MRCSNFLDKYNLGYNYANRQSAADGKSLTATAGISTADCPEAGLFVPDSRDHVI